MQSLAVRAVTTAESLPGRRGLLAELSTPFQSHKTIAIWDVQGRCSRTAAWPEPMTTEDPDVVRCELSVGRATCSLEPQQVAAALHALSR